MPQPTYGFRLAFGAVAEVKVINSLEVDTVAAGVRVIGGDGLR